MSDQDHTERDARIEAYLLETLSEQERQQFELELKNDPELAAELEAAAQVHKMALYDGRQHLKSKLQAIHAAGPPEATVIPMKSSRVQWLSIAAGVAVLVAVSLFFLLQNPAGDGLYAEYYEPFPDVVTTMGNSPASELEEAIRLYNDKDYEAALPLFLSYPDTSSSFQLAQLYAGICYLEAGDLAKAEAIFGRLDRADNMLYDGPARWYLALIELRRNNREGAVKLLRDLANKPSGAYTKKAEKLLADME